MNRPRARLAALTTAGLLAGLLSSALPGTSPATAAPGRGAAVGEGRDSGLEVYVGEVDRRDLGAFGRAGLDHEDVSVGRGSTPGTAAVEVVMNGRQAADLAGLGLQVKRVKGKKASEAARDQAVQGYRAFRSYSERGGIADELRAAAAAHPGIAQLQTVGYSVQGQPILALKVTKQAGQRPDGSRPVVLYNGTQHAREWITPEMVRRLMHAFLDGYGNDARLTRLVDTRELWFLPVANPDGYDYTFTPGGRLWRKNLRDNDSDGAITNADGVDPNRNFAYKWGYDDEGSSPDPTSETYRGTAPGSEPETRAMDGLVRRLRPAFQVNYHSAAELILYGVGWQVTTPSPDDQLSIALSGDDARPAVPGYDPDINAELYTTNGETTNHVQANYGTTAFTPEMSTCRTASAKYADDAFEPGDCISVFTFPDDERLISEEYRANVPFALSLAESAADPSEPVSAVGRTAPDLVPDTFTVSYGTPQAVAVVAKRSLANLRLSWTVNGATKPTGTKVTEWKGGERYGADGTTVYAEYRGVVTGTRPGDEVTVTFVAEKAGKGRVSSEPFTYTVSPAGTGAPVLVLAAEDQTGRSPGGPRGTSAEHADTYQQALTAAGYRSDVYDMDTQGRLAPHPLGVLSHYRAVVWETGDDILPRDVGQPAGTAAKSALDTEIAVRDFLNEGGKLLYAGQYAGFASGADGIYDYNPDYPTQGQCTTPDTYPCLPLFNDFQQYWLGAYSYLDDGGTDDDGAPFPLAGSGAGFEGFLASLNGGDSADNQGHTASFLATSSILSPTSYPQFASSAPIEWVRPGGSPYDPRTGSWYVYSGRSDRAYERLSRTVDLTGATTGSLDFQVSFDTEADWDYVVVEAHPVGSDAWTTLPDRNGHTGTDTGESCPADWGAQLHPFLAHYQTRLADGSCTATGTTGTWHAATGKSGGYQSWSVDLSPYAGQQVEVSISYLTDFAVQGLGVFLDDTTVTVDGVPVATTSFEDGLGGWAVPGPPAGSASGSSDWARTQSAFDEGAGVLTADTVYVGFGVEGLTTAAQRTDFMRRTMRHLLG